MAAVHFYLIRIFPLKTLLLTLTTVPYPGHLTCPSCCYDWWHLVSQALHMYLIALQCPIPGFHSVIFSFFPPSITRTSLESLRQIPSPLVYQVGWLAAPRQSDSYQFFSICHQLTHLTRSHTTNISPAIPTNICQFYFFFEGLKDKYFSLVSYTPLISTSRKLNPLSIIIKYGSWVGF